MRYLPCLLLIGASLPFCALAQRPPENRQQKAEQSLHPKALVPESQPVVLQQLEDRMRQQKVNGISIAVIDGNHIEWAKGYGRPDAGDAGTQVDTATLFQCASIGKTITALAVLHLVKENRVGLDESINNKLLHWKVPESDKTANKKVTLRTLLSHTAGFDDDYGFEGYAPYSPLPDLQQMLNSDPPANTHKKLVVKTIPGAIEKYSGGGFLVIQQLVEDITGVPFDNYVDSIVFKPLLMLHTTYAHYPDALGMPIARGHDDNGKVDKKRKYNVYPELAAAGPWTTATDLARLVLEIQKEYNGLSQTVADSSLVRQVLTPQINTTGLGVHLKGTSNVAAFWHAGNTTGFTGVLFGTTSGQGAIVLTNSDSGEWLALEIIRSIADVYNWPAMQTQYLSETIAPEYDRFAGQYTNGKTSLFIGRNDKGLFLRSAADKNDFTLYRLRDSSFLIKEKPEHLRLFFDETPGNPVTALHFFQDCGKAIGTLQKAP